MKIESELQLLSKKVGQYSFMKDSIRTMTKHKLNRDLNEKKA